MPAPVRPANGQAHAYAYEKLPIQRGRPTDGQAHAYAYENTLNTTNPNKLFVWSESLQDWIRIPWYTWNGTAWVQVA